MRSRPPALDRRFEAVLFDWDGTAVANRAADASAVRERVEALCAAGVEVIVVSGTNLENVDGQLGARPAGPGRLQLSLNRGSEVFRVDENGPRAVWRRVATAAEEAALTAAAGLVAKRLADRGLEVAIVSERLNRRKIDLIPEPEWADPPKARIGELVAAVEERLTRAGIGGLREAAGLARAAATEAGLPDARVTSDAKHVEIGLTDKSDASRWAFGELWRRGVGASLVLVAGDELGPLGGLPGSDSLLVVPEAARATVVSVGPEPTGVPAGVVALGGGPAAFLELLESQLERRARGDVPELDRDPAWTIEVEGLDPRLERVRGVLFTLADGRMGTRGSPLAHHRSARPEVLLAGVYAGEGPETELVPGPVWNLLAWELGPDVGLRRVLDLRTGVLRQELSTPGGPLVAVELSSLARPGTAVFRAEGPAGLLQPGAPFVGPPDEAGVETGKAGDRRFVRIVPGPPRPLQGVAPQGGVVAVAAEVVRYLGDRHGLDRVAAYAGDPARAPAPEEALPALAEAEAAGFERLLVEHREAWSARWEDADIRIEGDPELQRAVRFALFHLIAAADGGEAAVGARGLTGQAYRGHVFWDTDVYVLPFLAATNPEAGRAVHEYRVRRLPAARQAAARAGYEGARFPWESASSGFDVTPRSARDRTGQVVQILTGAEEEHVVADVAWGAACYLDWTGDEEFAAGPGRLLLVETARYWASRISLDADGRGHIRGVIGPDEYHEGVDDNAFTNVMARWNLRRAATAVRDHPGGVEDGEVERWLTVAEAIVDGYDPATGVYEEFAGFLDLEPLVIADVAPRRPIMADALIGRERVQGAQVVKQADVLMLHHLVPDELADGSLDPNLDFYEPRTAHGSSLSPGVHASLQARAGRLDEAVRWLRLAGRIDLDDLTGTTAGGLHFAAMGSVWQALALGFAGLRPRGGILELDPRLPDGWDALELRVRFRGSRVRVRIEPGTVHVAADPATTVALAGGGGPVRVGPEGSALSWGRSARRGGG